MFEHIRSERNIRYGKDSSHEVYTNDLFKRYGAELHRFCNGGGQPYSAIYRGDFEEMSCERDHEDDMIAAFKRRLYAERFGAKNVMG